MLHVLFFVPIPEYVKRLVFVYVFYRIEFLYTSQLAHFVLKKRLYILKMLIIRGGRGEFTFFFANIGIFANAIFSPHFPNIMIFFFCISLEIVEKIFHSLKLRKSESIAYFFCNNLTPFLLHHLLPLI